MRQVLAACLVLGSLALTACDPDVGVPDPSIPCGDTSCTSPQVCVAGQCADPADATATTDVAADVTAVTDVVADVTAVVDAVQDAEPKDTGLLTNPFVTACLTSKCTAEITACTGACATWLTCAKGCEASDFTCQNTCGKLTTDDAKATAKVQKVLICFSTNAAACKPAADAFTGETTDAKDADTGPVTTSTIPDWLLPDTNPNSATHGKQVGPAQWPGQNVIVAMVAGWSAASLAMVDVLTQVSDSTTPSKFKTIYVVDPSQPDALYTHTKAPVVMDLWSNHTATLPDGSVLTAGKHDVFGYNGNGRLIGYFQGTGTVATTALKTFAEDIGKAPAGSLTYYVSCPKAGISGCKVTP